MTPMLAGFVDVGYVRAALADLRGVHRAGVRVNAAAVTSLVAGIARSSGEGVLRTYWYDGRLPDSDPRAASQQKYLNAVARLPGIKLRVGQLVERTPAWHAQLRAAMGRLGVAEEDLAAVMPLHPELVQKGVDTHLAVDLVTLAYRKAVSSVCLITGDRDLEPALAVVANLGCRVVLVTLPGREPAGAVQALADEVVPLGVDDLMALDFGTPPAPRTSAEEFARQVEAAVAGQVSARSGT